MNKETKRFSRMVIDSSTVDLLCTLQAKQKAQKKGALLSILDMPPSRENEKSATSMNNLFRGLPFSQENKRYTNTRKAKKPWGNKMMRNKGARLWKALPSSLKSIQNPKKFAVKLKKAFLINTNLSLVS